MLMTDDEFKNAVLKNPYNAKILTSLPRLGVPDAYLVAGCLFQTIWNTRTGREPTRNIKDYDVFYFDDRDLSWEAEDSIIRRAARLFADLPIKVEVRNQARVHLWYRQKFGGDYPKLRCSCDGIDRYLIACTCVGIKGDDQHQVYSPSGYDDLLAGRLKINPKNPRPDLFQKKALSYKSRWPWLVIDEV